MSVDHMPPATFLDNLLYPLLFRARTSQDRSYLRFKDKAAELLVEKLDLKDYVVHQNQNRYETTVEINRCLWIDKVVLDFFNKYPTAIGINLNCGLSTRFHRISQQLEWPRFRWADVDTQDTTSFNRGLLPNLDNYRAIGCEHWLEDWLPRTGWTKGTPIIIVIEDFKELQSSITLEQLFDYLRNTIQPRVPTPIHIVIDFPLERDSLIKRVLTKLRLSALIKGLSKDAVETDTKNDMESWVKAKLAPSCILENVDLTTLRLTSERGQQSKVLATKRWSGLHIALQGTASDSILKL